MELKIEDSYCIVVFREKGKIKKVFVIVIQSIDNLLKGIYNFF